MNSLDILYLLIIWNIFLISALVILSKPLTRKYTFVLVARKVGSYLLTLIMLSLVGLYTFGKYKIMEFVIYFVNISFSLIIITYMGFMIRQRLQTKE